MRENELFERTTGAEVEESRTVPSNGPRRNLNDPHVLAIDPQLRVHGSFPETVGAAGFDHSCEYPVLDCRRES